MLYKKVALFVITLAFSQVIGDPVQVKNNETPEVFKFPQLVLRPVAFSKYLLDVYNPESMTNFVQNTKAKINNPSCQLEGGNLLKSKDNLVKVEFLAKSEVSNLDVNHTLTKATYRVIVESQGYIRCKAEIFGHGEVASTRKLYRYVDHVFAMNVIYNCTKTKCDNVKALANILAARLTSNIDKTTLNLHDILVTPVRKTVEKDETSILYHVQIEIIPSLIMQQRIARNSQKERDTELLNFLNDVVRNHFTAEDLSHGACSFIRSTKFCPAKEVDKLSWPVTEIGMKAATEELCVGSDGGPIVLECLGDFVLGAFWDAESIPECQYSTTRMEKLYQLSRNESLNKITAKENIKTLESVLVHQGDNDKETDPLTKVEINYVAEALSNFSPNVIDVADISGIANITNILMKKSKYVNEKSKIIYKNELKSAQEASNSSNRILDSLDRVLNKATINGTSQLIITENFVTLMVDISAPTEMKRIRGIAAMKPLESLVETFNSENVILLMEDDGLEDVLDMDVAVAVLVPKELYQPTNGKDNRLVINLFRQDSFFGTQQTIGKANMVLSVTLNGRRYQSLDSPLILLFETDPQNQYVQENSFSQSPCVFWDFLADDNNGGWSNYGCELAKPRNQTLQKFDVCLCSHLTHFAELLRDDPADIISISEKIALDLITVVGCSLSLVGLTAIGVTAMIFPAWRKGASKKVQLALCASLTILMTSFLVVSFTKGKQVYEGIMESAQCIIAGFFLHYSILSSFCWMIVAAWGQYLRLTKPLISLNRQPHFILKSSLFAWGLPIIPCITVLAVDYQVYDPPNCYPTGYFLYLSVLLPVVLAVALNGTIFVLILFSIYNCCGLGMGLVQLRNNQSKRRIACRKIATVMFLFFLLGMSWIFGILNMRYLFCITASTQGFAVFIFFVVLDKSTRGKWCTLFETKNEVHNLNSYSNSADFIRRFSRHSHTHSRYASTRVSTLSDSR